MRDSLESVNFSHPRLHEISFIDSNSINKKTDRPFITIHVANKNLSCLVDSGATASVCNEDGMKLFISLGFKLLKIKAFPATLANGSTCELKEYFSIPVSFQNKTSLINFFVCKTSTQKFLLAADFYKDFKLEMSYGNEGWSFQSHSHESQNSITDVIDLNSGQLKQLSSIIKKFDSLCTGTLGRANVFEHNIDTGDSEPIFQRPYPVSPAIQQRMHKELDRMIELGVIEPANSPWCNQPLLVKKKREKIDYASTVES